MPLRPFALGLFALGALAVACHAYARGEEASPISELSENELRLALADSTHGFVTYRAGPSPRSDSARRLAGAGAWAMEGGQYERAFRLLRAAYALGVEDSLFVYDTGEMLKLLRCPRERVALYARA